MNAFVESLLARHKGISIYKSGGRYCVEIFDCIGTLTVYGKTLEEAIDNAKLRSEKLMDA